MDVISGWLPWGDEAFPFHGPVKWGEAGRHWSKLKVVLALVQDYYKCEGVRHLIITIGIQLYPFSYKYCNCAFKQQYSIIPGQHLYSQAPWPVILHAALLLKRTVTFSSAWLLCKSTNASMCEVATQVPKIQSVFNSHCANRYWMLLYWFFLRTIGRSSYLSFAFSSSRSTPKIALVKIDSAVYKFGFMLTIDHKSSVQGEFTCINQGKHL